MLVLVHRRDSPYGCAMVGSNSNVGRPGFDLTTGRVPSGRTGIGDAPRIPGLPPRGPPIRKGRDPTDLRSAFDRLITLLNRDGEFGPRSGIPMRGFYLDILV